MSMFGLAWFLSVLYLVLMTHITSKIEDEDVKNAIQGLMIALWVALGVITAIFF